MASLQKLTITRYVDRHGRQVPKGTKGAKKVKEESAKWYACWREGKRQVRIPLATDKEAAQAMLADLLRARERGQAGLIDKFREHLDKPLKDHVDDYLAVVRSTTGSERHQTETARILNLFVRDGGATTLRDVTADRVATYLSKLTSGPTTRNMHRRILVMLMNHLEERGRIDRNPITLKSVKPARKGKKRERRALTADEIFNLLQAVRDYPLKSASVNKGGRPKKNPTDRPSSPADRPAKLKSAYIAKLQQRGRERALMYRLAVLTGLRRGELSRLRVSHLELDRQPFARLNLPAHLTKNHKPARILLVPSLAADLRQWISDMGKKPSDAVVSVPNRCNLAKLHKAHLALAGIAYEVDGRFADFHSLRMSANVVLRKAGIPPKERQLFLRHGKLELTTETYDDESHAEMTDVVKALADTKL